MPPKEKYTDPDLREEIKEEVKAGDKGGAPGQWSARKAQLMASEYKKRGGDYNGPKTDSQKHLSQWTDEEWQTKEGSAHAKQADGTEKRYLPKKAWEKMTEEEKQETEDKKAEGSRRGEQYVGNTETAKSARKEVQEHGKGEGSEEDAGKGDGDKDGEHHGQRTTRGKKAHDEEDGHKTESHEEDMSNSKGEKETSKNHKTHQTHDETNEATTSKRAHPSSPSTPSKKTKTSSSSSSSKANKKNSTASEPPAPAGSAERLPKKGQKVSWRTLQGYVHGEVIEVSTEEKEVEGKKVKGSEGDPRIVMRSERGAVAVHRAEAVFFED